MKKNILKITHIMVMIFFLIIFSCNVQGNVLQQVTDSMYLSGGQWAISKIELDKAWNMSTGSPTILVGVMDFAVDNEHPEISYNYNNELSKNFTANVDGLPSEHGTFVAGIIGAETGNSAGIAGVCWDVDLVSLRVDASSAANDIQKVFDAIDYASNNNIKILNMSFAYSINDLTNEQINDFKTRIENFNGLVVCGAGNSGQNIDLSNNYIYPACFELDNLITVGATNSNDLRSTWMKDGDVLQSNYGKSKVDLFAPGIDILSTIPESACDNSCIDNPNHYSNGYHYDSGTSFASPYVAGVAALLLSINPNLTPKQLKQILLSSVDPIASLSDECVSGGRLNAYSALYSIHSTHNYNYEYESYSNNSHYAYCSCGNYQIIQHDIICTSINDTNHKISCEQCEYSSIVLHDNSYYSYNQTEHALKCNDCNHIIYENHTLTYSNSTNTNHYEMCNCGYSNTITHSYTYTRYNTSSHKTNCLCGYESIDPHVVRASDLGASIKYCKYCNALISDAGFGEVGGLAVTPIKVSKNGSYILPSGIIVLVDEDVDLYENKCLVFYANDESEK